MEKQGIVTILGSDCERTKAASLRRTLSADMSSKKWLAQNGFSPLKKIASSRELSVSLADSSSSSEGEEDYGEGKEQLLGRGQFHIWSSIQEEKKQKKELEKPGQFDIWSAIVSQKADEDSSKPLPPPYIHPLVKRSASSLSEKSLEVCTESLGSETGSDGFSSYPPSETGDVEEDKEEEEEEEPQQLQEDLKVDTQSFGREEWRVGKYHYASSKKSQPKSFPPPLPSLSRQDGASLRMQSRRDNGRLVLKAVSVRPQNHFHAQRQDGRLVLTFVGSPSNEEAKGEEMVEKYLQQEEEEENEKEGVDEDQLGDFEEVFEEEEEGCQEINEEAEEVEEVDKEDGTKEFDFVIEEAPKFSSRAINVHRLALMVNKPIRRAERNPAWPRKFNEIVKFEEEAEEVEVEPSTVTKSLPPRPRVSRLLPSAPAVPSSTAASASFNPYEYYWRAKPTVHPITQQPPAHKINNFNKFIISKDPMPNKQQQLLVLRGNIKGEYLVPLVKACKEPRRSLLFWEPYCIATS